MATKKSEAQTSTQPIECRLRKLYKETVVPQLIKEFGYQNINEVPRLEKIVINAGLGDVKDNSKSFQLAGTESNLRSETACDQQQTVRSELQSA